MLDAHTSLGIAQVVFYVPIVPLAIYLIVRNWAYRPRMAWWPMVPLSLMRLVGGVITIVLEERSKDIGLYVAAIVLLNVGAIPLVVANLGQIRLIIIDSLSESPLYHKLAVGMRICFAVAVALLVAGGSIASGNSASSLQLAKWLSLAGYCIFAFILLVLVTLELFLLTKRESLVPSSRKILRGLLISAPFIAIRCVYGILETVSGYTSTVWSPIFGSIAAFVLMALICEYIPICIWLYIGYSLPPNRGVRTPANRTDVQKDVV